MKHETTQPDTKFHRSTLKTTSLLACVTKPQKTVKNIASAHNRGSNDISLKSLVN